MTPTPQLSDTPSSATTQPPPVREVGLDALRTLAVLGMMAAHTSRLIVFDARPEWSRWVLLLEPVIPTLFLLLVGLSLAKSFDAAKGRGQTPHAWFVRQLRRATVLWCISAVFFTLELGARLPDTLVASGILANIAYAIVITAALLALPARALLLALTALGGTAIFVALDLNGQRIFPLNIGNSPYLPLWLFAIAGALWGTVAGAGSARIKRTLHRILPAIALVGGAVAIALIAHYGVDTLFTKPFGRSDATRAMAAPLFGGNGVPIQVSYYNLRPILALACLGLQLIALVTLGALLKWMKPGVAHVLFALGRYALTAYILHLALLAMLVVAIGPQPLSEAWQGAVTLIGLVMVCMIIVLRRKIRR